ncbi:MAG TPA: class I SAM-dependent methyltransferase [Acidimicrobiales bacterium]|nr:class I SAM-dependent methyltransferase [Acidimicrobiales bacterium]
MTDPRPAAATSEMEAPAPAGGPPPCRSCRAPLTETFVDLGSMPLANGLLTAEQRGREPALPLHARVCGRCLLVQLEALVSSETLFRDYTYFSSYSDSWLEHARRFAARCVAGLGLAGDSLVVEVASNDGYLLRHFLGHGIPVLGVEPAANVAAVAVEHGVPTVVEFFGRDLAASLAGEGRRADLVVANNVVAHVPDLHDFVAGLAVVLAPSGVLSIEVPHLQELIAGVQFDTIYHEHFSYFSLLALEGVLGRHGLRVFDVERLPTHGGSLRVWACHARADRPSHARVEQVRQGEREAGLDRLDTYVGFDRAVRRCGDSFVEFLGETRAAGRTLVGYGAAAKGCTFLNYCGVSVEDVPYVVDRSPHKQGRYLPGVHVPVEAPDRVAATRPDYLLILPWNLRDEIVGQMAGIRAWGGRFVTAVPEVALTP